LNNYNIRALNNQLH